MKTLRTGAKKVLGEGKGRSDPGKLRQAFYKSDRWRQLRSQHLKAMPYCEKCLEETGTANRQKVIVDHIYGHDDEDWLIRFWNPVYLQTLCTKHHNRKTAKERPDSGFNKPAVKRMTATERSKIRERLRASAKPSKQ